MSMDSNKKNDVVKSSNSNGSVTKLQELDNIIHSRGDSPSPLTALPDTNISMKKGNAIDSSRQNNVDKNNINDEINMKGKDTIEQEKDLPRVEDDKRDKDVPYKHTDKYIPQPNKTDTVRIRLNPSAIYPTTVPPFVLDEIYNNRLNDDVETIDILYEVNNKSDNFSNNYHNWINLVHNVGSNIEYLENQKSKIIIVHKNSIKQDKTTTKDPIHFRSTFHENATLDSNSVKSFFPEIVAKPKSTKDISIPSNHGNELENYSTNEESHKIILGDLSSPWKGDERLNEIFEFNNANYEFNKNREMEKQWNEYLPRLLQRVYHSKLKHGGDPTLVDDLEKQQQDLDINQNQKNKTKAPPGSFEAETERWKKYYNKKVQGLAPKFNDLIDNSRFLPLALRIIIFIMALISLGLSVRILQNSRAQILVDRITVPIQSSIIMSIVVNTLAIIYTSYIALNEYHGKPIGLRDTKSKMIIISMDSLFIIFTSATLALAFDSRFDDFWVCNRSSKAEQLGFDFPYISYICRKQDALVAFLFVMVFFWVCASFILILKIVRRSAKV